jgi:hypothetical protein
MKKHQTLCLIICLLASHCFSQQVEEWYTSNLANTPISFLRESLHTENGKITSAPFMKLIFNRKNSKIEMLLQSEITENTNRDFLTARGNIKTTGQDIAVEGVLKEDTMFITSFTGGKTYHSKLLIKEKLMAPLAVKKLSKKTLKHPGDSITYATFSPDLGNIIHVTRKYVDKQSIIINGTSHTTVRIKEVFKENPYSKDFFVDEQYNLLKTIDPL